MRALTQAAYPFQPVPFTRVSIDDGFWRPRLETNRRVTLPFALKKLEQTGRIANFARAGSLEPGPHQGRRYNDSDVFKVLEGAADTLQLQPDPALDTHLDALIAKIAAAQEDDGYLYTARTIDPAHPPEPAGPARWSFLEQSHELYNVGHLYEAAAAHYQATGKRTLLDVALKNAALLTRVFGPEGRHDPPGHQEIEIGLVKLYRITGDGRYLQLAKFFLDARGRAHGRSLYGPYSQDHAPVVEQREAVGHAVRALYMYTAMADIAALTGDAGYVRAIDGLWEDVVRRKLYLTGGVGARHEGEAFGDAYELPNRTAYAETCAAIANVFWNYRLFLLHGDARYIDVLERTLYNGLLAGVSLDGERFFYPNPLASDGEFAFNAGRAATRQPWFDCACCPTNLVRFLPSLSGYVYAQREDALYVNLFVGGEARLRVREMPLRLWQTTRYPWDGAVTFFVEPEAPLTFTLYLRIPGWARGQPVPGDLYRYLEAEALPVSLAVNGEPWPVETERGFVPLRRRWRRGDVVELTLPLPVRRVVAHLRVAADRGKVALERGPLVYCVEGVDHAASVFDLVVPDGAPLRAERREGLLSGVTVLRGPVQTTAGATAELTAVPYYAWSHRGVGEMTVWLRH
ncbi:MAG: glycoside hydrolase family 127 protein [Anaerolineae bacterium]